MPKNEDWLFPLFTDHAVYAREMIKLSDFHLYTGSKCNRACDFCIVSGRPDGWYQPLTPEILDSVLELVPPDATVKFYGGEPTIDTANVVWAMQYLRQKNFAGWFTIFSNGVLADRVIRILEADEKIDVVLNYSILHGEDAEPIPPQSLQKLKEYADVHPNRVYSSHAGVFPYGRAVEFQATVGQPHIIERMNTSYNKFVQIGRVTTEQAAAVADSGFKSCPRCRPALRTDGVFHACPFAVESNEPHFHLGKLGENSEAEVLSNFQNFLDWIDDTLEPAAKRLQLHPCQVCTHNLGGVAAYSERTKNEA